MGRSPCCVKEGLKKGPWTQEEDEKLIAFVTEHGHGNWRALPKKCGLLRCGKSCRLRWNNYLRPDIKRGLFTQSEEQKIIQLHALVGNKWAFIASQLPKRTDNEIKNYWNTVLKKRLEKLGLSSLMSFGAPKTDRTLIPAAERQRQDSNRGMQREDNENNKSSSSASKKASCNNSTSVMSYTHLAQWENARLEAEARLAKESQSSKTHKLFSLAYMGHSFSSSTTTSTAFSSFSNHTHTNQLSTCSIPNILPSSISKPCLIHHPSTINPLFNGSSLSLHAIVSSLSASNSSSTSSSIQSSKSLGSLASQESIASAPTLRPSGRLSWQTKEMSGFPTSPFMSHTSQSSLISQLLCQIERGHGQEVELQASTKEGLQLKANRGQEELNLEAATSSIVDPSSTMESSKDLNSTMENWNDFIFDVENSCSDVVSTTNWKGPIVSREEFTHDSNSLINNTNIKSGALQCPQGTLDLEGLNLFQFDSLMSCDHYANQHSNVLMKELLWDTPTTLSISSSSIVN